jgi:hypothetical protein
MERRRLTKRQVRTTKPNLYHEPSDRLESPFLGSEGPKSKEQPRETDGRNAHKKYEFSCHSTESATCIGVVGKSNVKEGRSKTYRITTLLETMKNASLNGHCKLAPKQKGVTIRPWEEDAAPTGENVKAQVRRRLYGPNRMRWTARGRVETGITHCLRSKGPSIEG